MTKQTQELVKFLKERSLFKVLDDRVLNGISPLFEEVHCGPGHIVFREGDEADAIYLIREGSVEVLQGQPPQVIAYFTSGDCFGEMALVHNTTRNATVRVPEEAIVLKLSRKAFNELQSYFPVVTREVTQVINRRLSGKKPVEVPGLQGNLAFFDLPTVVQTVTASRQSGSINLFGRSGQLRAKVLVKQGRLTHATFGHLSGEWALFELLTRQEPLDFKFEPQRSADTSAAIDRDLASKEPHMLLIEGARRADELPQLLKSTGWPGAIYTPGSRDTTISALPESVQAIARKILLLLEANLTIEEVTEKVPYDRYTVLQTVEELAKRSLLTCSSAPSAISEPAAPNKVAPLIHALNAVTANLAKILPPEETRACLKEALSESKSRYACLSSLELSRDTVSVDLHRASPEVSQSADSGEALKHLTVAFLQKAAECRLARKA